MNKLEAIAASKQFRKDADELLQRMKEHKIALMTRPRPTIEDLEKILEREDDKQKVSVNPDGSLGLPTGGWGDDESEAIAQHTLSIRDLETCIMRQGMALKYIGNPDPYPESRDPSSSKVEPTADGLKM